jgi:hypothetical protein
MRSRFAMCCSGIAAILLGAPSAGADSWLAPSGLHGAGLGMGSNALGHAYADTAFFTRDGTTLLSPIFGAGFRVAPEVELEVALPLSFVFGDASASLVGNPYLGVSYVLDGPSTRVKLGGGLGLPITDVADSDEFAALAGAVASRGMQESWFWFDDALPIVFPLRLETPALGGVRFTLDAALSFITPMGRRDEAELVVQAAPGVAARVSDAVSTGARLTFFAVPTADAGDRDQLDQLALEPFLRIEGESFFFSTRLTVNLDEPLGFSFDRRKIWGLHVGVGGAF